MADEEPGTALVPSLETDQEELATVGPDDEDQYKLAVGLISLWKVLGMTQTEAWRAMHPNDADRGRRCGEDALQPCDQVVSGAVRAAVAGPARYVQPRAVPDPARGGGGAAGDDLVQVAQEGGTGLEDAGRMPGAT